MKLKYLTTYKNTILLLYDFVHQHHVNQGREIYYNKYFLFKDVVEYDWINTNLI